MRVELNFYSDIVLQAKVEKVVELYRARKELEIYLEQCRLSIECCLNAGKERREIELSFFVELGDNAQTFFSLEADSLKDILTQRGRDIVTKINDIDKELEGLIKRGPNDVKTNFIC